MALFRRFYAKPYSLTRSCSKQQHINMSSRGDLRIPSSQHKEQQLFGLPDVTSLRFAYSVGSRTGPAPPPGSPRR